MNIFFSIILPTYNRAHRLEKAIDSILNQEFTDWELLIIDDASTDNTLSLISKYNDARIRYIRNEKNEERCISRNIGIRQSIGKYICFLDSDDYHLPNHLAVFHDFILAHNYPQAFIFTNAWDENENGERTERVCPDIFQTDLYTYFLRFTVNPQRWCIHREILETVQFDPEIIICEDMDMSLTIVGKGYPVFQITERTTVYVAASDSFTHGASDKWEKELFYLKRIFLKKQFKKGIPRREKNRLLSMCYYHLSQNAFVKEAKWNTIRLSIISFVLYPKGYNLKTNKILFVSIIYSIPILSTFIKLFARK